MREFDRPDLGAKNAPERPLDQAGDLGLQGA
jgi:hypothetical protein